MTNLLAQSENFGHDVWHKTAGGATVTDNSTAPPSGFAGAANADTVADNSAGAAQRIYQDYVKLSSDAGNYCFSLFVRKDTDTSRYPQLYMEFQGGASPFVVGVNIDTQNGTLDDPAGILPTGFGISSYDADYWRVYIREPDSGSNTNVRVSYYPARNTVSTAFESVAAQGSSIAWGAQLEAGVTTPSAYSPSVIANMLVASEDFSDADWANNNLTLTANTEAAPMPYRVHGARGATRIADEDSGAQGNMFGNYYAMTPNSMYIGSIFIRKEADGGRFPSFGMQMINGVVPAITSFTMSTFDGSVGVPNGGTAPTAYRVENYNEEWWRVWWKVIDTGSNTLVRIFWFPAIYDAVNNSSESSGLTGGITAHGAMLEEAGVLSDYAPSPPYSVPVTVFETIAVTTFTG
jgi:hypothetical protein